MSSQKETISFTRRYDMLTPKGGQTLAIDVDDWNYLRKMIDRLKLGDPLWKTISSVCFGCAPTALITAITLWPDSVKKEAFNIPCVIWIAVSIGTLIFGLMALWFAYQKREIDKFSQTQILDEIKRMEQRFNEDSYVSKNLITNHIQNIEQNTSKETIRNSSKSLALPQSIPQKESLISNLKNARFLDWISETWNNDIRQFCYFKEVGDGYKLIQDIQSGYDYKMILFDKEYIHSSKMITLLTVEEGSVEIALRPRDLSPRGTVTRLYKGTYYIEFWIENEEARIRVNGDPKAILENKPENYGRYSIMTSKKCTVVFHKLDFLDYRGLGTKKVEDSMASSLISWAIQKNEQEKNAQSKLTIEKAIYSAGAISNDVTELVIKYLINDHLFLIVENNNLGGDPIYGEKKTLTITYSIGDKQETKSFPEHNSVELP